MLGTVPQHWHLYRSQCREVRHTALLAGQTEESENGVLNPRPVTHWGLFAATPPKKSDSAGHGCTRHCSHVGSWGRITARLHLKISKYLSVSSLTSSYKQNSWPVVWGGGGGNLQHQSIRKWTKTTVEVTTLKCSETGKGRGLVPSSGFPAFRQTWRSYSSYASPLSRPRLPRGRLAAGQLGLP